MRTHRWWMGAIVLAGLLSAAPGGVRGEEADTEAPADEAAGACVTACESQHDGCVTAAKARAADCERQKATCDRTCALCTRMNGPAVLACISDCETCRARLAASKCTTAPADEAECQPALDACLERCGP